MFESGPLLSFLNAGAGRPRRARRAAPTEGSGFVGRPWGPTSLRPGPEARALARHKQSSGLFVSGLGASDSGGPGATRYVRCAHCAQPLPGKSDDDARCARAARILRFSPTHYSPSAGVARRANPTFVVRAHATNVVAKAARGALRRPSEAPRSCARTQTVLCAWRRPGPPGPGGGLPARARQRASSSDLRWGCLSGVSAANAASYPPGPEDRCSAPGRPAAHCGLPGAWRTALRLQAQSLQGSRPPQGRPPQLGAAARPEPPLLPQRSHARTKQTTSKGHTQTLG